MWKDIKGYNGEYKINECGRVCSLKFNKYKILKQIKTKSGRLQVQLCKNGKMKTYLVHRLVASAFIPNYDNLPEVNHKDENPLNNNVNNLEWCSRKYNANYGTGNERRNRGKYKAVAQYSMDNKLIKEYDSILKASLENNLDNSAIVKCCKGKISHTGNYHWRYII